VATGAWTRRARCATCRPGALAAALSGAGVGGLVGAAGGITVVPAAIIGGLAGLGGYHASKMW
jgi:hypothetical protein